MSQSKRPKFCPKCHGETSPKHNFCPNCGFMIIKPQINYNSSLGARNSRPSKSRVDEAFDNLGLDGKMLKEQGLSKEKILSELAGSVKPKEEVTIGGTKEILKGVAP